MNQWFVSPFCHHIHDLDTEAVNNVTIVKVFHIVDVMQNAPINEIIGKCDGTASIRCQTDGD